MDDIVLGILALLFPAPLEGLAVDDVPELPAEWSSMVDMMDPLDSSLFIDVIFNDIPPYFVTNTCIMESACRRAISIHKGDTRYRKGKRKGQRIGADIYGRQVEFGHLDGDCPFYEPTDDPDWLDNWTTRGNHGLMFGYNRKRIGTCFPMEWFDIPLVSALATARKAQAICRRLESKKKKCTGEALRIAWSQAKSKKRKRKVRQLWRTRTRKIKKTIKTVDWENPPTMKDYRERSKQSTQVYEPST